MPSCARQSWPSVPPAGFRHPVDVEDLDAEPLVSLFFIASENASAPKIPY
jgi:hypothetical protein